MKKYLKYSTYIILVIAIFMLMQCHVPFLAERIYGEIKTGMMAKDVVNTISKGYIKPTSCHWRNEGEDGYPSPNRAMCNVPQEIELKSNTVELSVLYMGPGYLHNDFTVVFKFGVVSNISEFKQWD